MKLLRKTKGVCTRCYEAVPADMVLREEDDYIVLQKHCPTDGVTEDEVTSNGAFFGELDAFYQRIMKRMPQQSYFAEIHSTCNLSCKFCYVKDKVPDAMPDFSFDEVDEQYLKGKVINLIGAEPTLSPTLLEKIRSIRERGGIPQLSTNGVVCKSPDFVAQLKEAGVDRLFIQFDSLTDEYYEDVCGIPLVEQKLRAVKNLDDAGILTTLRAVVIKGSNDHEIWDLIDFLQKHDATVSVHLMGLSKIGMALENYEGQSMMPLDVVKRFCELSKGVVEMRDVLVFLKTFYAWTAMESVKWCMHIYPFLLLPEGDSYITYTSILDRDRLDAALERFNEKFNKKDRKRNRARFAWTLLRAIKPWGLVRHGWRHKRLIGAFLKGGRRGLAKKFCEVNFFTICSPDIVDFDIINNCNAGMISKHESVPMVMENIAHSVYLREKFYHGKGESFGPTHLAGAREQAEQALT